MSRRCLDFMGPDLGNRLSRRHLENVAIRQVEGPHLEEVGAAEPAPEAVAKVPGELPDQLAAVVRSRRAVLLLLDDAATDSPVGRGHDRVHRPGSTPARGCDQADDICEHRVVARLLRSSDVGPLARHARGECLVKPRNDKSDRPLPTDRERHGTTGSSRVLGPTFSSRRRTGSIHPDSSPRPRLRTPRRRRRLAPSSGPGTLRRSRCSPRRR